MAVDMFMKIDTVDGEAQDSKHKKEIDVLSWSWGLSNAGSAHSGGGAGAGKANVHDLSFTKWVDSAVKYSDAERAVKFEIVGASTDIVCTICDHGIGIPEADLEWLFNAFHRGCNVGDRPGTGLGLVIVKRCVDLHGGRIKVDSKVGEGRSVILSLPLFQPGVHDRS
jgi:light-regulated signal transduction histidine kinase (bacteriophytochrome)